MSKIYSPRIVQDSLVMCLDPSQNKSYPTTDLPVKDGLGLWLDASDDTTFSYSSGTSVSQWRDKSGNNFHASQALSANQPSRSTTQNSRKTVNFDGTNDTVTIPNFVCNSEMSIFVVSNCGTSLFIEHSTDTNSNSGFYLGGQGTGMFAINRSPGIIYINNTNWLSGGYSIASAVNSTGLDMLAYKNGTQQSLTLDARASRSNSYITANLYIGSRGASSIWTAGPIAEIIIYNRKVSDTERNLIHTYLGQKWGISNTDRSIIDLSGNGINPEMSNTIFSPDNRGVINFNGKAAATNAVSVIKTTTSIINRNDGQEITVSCWIKPLRTSGQYSIIATNRSNDDSIYNWIFYQHTDNGAISFHGDAQNKSTYVPTINQWINAVNTVTAAGVSTLYINGVSVFVVNGYTYGNGTPSRLGIGADPSSNESFQGSIAQTLIYNRALSAVEVLQNYESLKSKFANTIVESGLVLNLDAGNPYSYAGAGTTWYDVSGAVNDFAIVNSPTYSVDQFVLNGSTQYFSISTGSGFFISSTNNFYADAGYAWSISVWFKFPVTPTNVRDGSNNGGNCSYCMVGNSGGIGGAETLALFVSGVSGTTAGFHPYYCVVGIRGSKTQLSPDQVNTNAWNNVVVTWNGSAGRGYFNGIDRGALNIGANGMQVSGYTIGTTVGGNQGSHTFEGSLSQVFVYNRAISATEVLQNYNALKGRFGL